MDKAVARIRQAIENYEQILVYGDYDADGMTSASIMKEALESTGLKVFGGENAPYLWVKAPGEVNSWKFFEQMLYEANVVARRE